MKFAADLHIHSYLSRACSPQLRPEPLHRWAQLKGLTVLGTGDFTHPAWLAELRKKLVPAEPGLYRLKDGPAREADAEVPDACRGPVRFLLSGELSCIYKRGGRVRKAHHILFAPDLDTAGRIGSRLEERGCNIRSDGRPILGMDSRDLFELALECGEGVHLVPAHVWTPHFSVFGSQSGFDSLEECFGGLADRIFALETGLSSDPPMNWRVRGLDEKTLISNSDAHSPEKLGREANLFDTELSYAEIFDAIRERRGFLGTIEFFPEEGKYHADGHRHCGVRLQPRETLARGGLCPKCGKPVTVGVLSRVEALATRKEGRRPKGAPGFESLVPLKEVLGQILGVGPGSKRVDREYRRLLALLGSELRILREAPLAAIEKAGPPRLAPGIRRMREGRVRAQAGYDGQYGTVSVSD